MSVSEVSLELTCDNSAAELLVVNDEFHVLATGASPLATKVGPGIYALKAKIGAQTSESLEVIDGSQPAYSFYLKAPPFESPMPLAHTSTSREYHEHSLDRFTKPGAAALALGEGSAIVLYVRDTSRRNFELKPDEATVYARSFSGFRLLDAAGRELVNFDDKATRNIEDGYIGARVRLAPGHYVLGWKHGHQETRLALNTAPGWSLNVFIRVQQAADSTAMVPNFSEAAFAYDKIDQPYSAHRDDFLMLEAARHALLDRRSIVTGQEMRDILVTKYDNPMLGVYGGHMLAATADVDLSFFGQVIANTAGLLGKDHPDIVALAWLYESKKRERLAGFDARPWPEILGALKGPPLLVQSWDALLACAEAAQFDIAKSPAFRVAGDLAVSGIVLTWEHRKSMDAPEAAPAAGGESVFSRIGKTIWNGIVRNVLGKKADGTIAPIPSLDVKVEDITTPEAAAEAVRLLAKKAHWDKWLSLVHKDRAKADNVATFSPLQRDLIATLARTTQDPETVQGVDENYIISIMQAHRVPLSTVAQALRALDVVAVTVEVLRRLKGALIDPPAGKKTD